MLLGILMLDFGAVMVDVFMTITMTGKREHWIMTHIFNGNDDISVA